VPSVFATRLNNPVLMRARLAGINQVRAFILCDRLDADRNVHGSSASRALLRCVRGRPLRRPESIVHKRMGNGPAWIAFQTSWDAVRTPVPNGARKAQLVGITPCPSAGRGLPMLVWQWHARLLCSLFCQRTIGRGLLFQLLANFRILL
jgi:hypothetical protein